MIFVILNILFAVILIWFTMMIDVKTDEEKIRPLINITLFVSVVALFNAASVMISFFNNTKISSVIGTLMLLMGAMLSVNYALYCLMYPKFKSNFLTIAFQVIFIGCAVYILFFQFDSLVVTSENGIVITGKPMNLPITIEGVSQITWMDLYYVIYIALLPLIGVLSLLVKMATGTQIVYRQQTLFTILSAVIVWGIFGLLFWVSKSYPAFAMYDTLFTVGLVLMVLMLYKSVTLSESFDVKSVLISLGKFFYTFLFEAILAGVLFALLLPLRQEQPVQFVLFYLLGVFVILLIGYNLAKFLRGRNKNYDSKYSRRLEEKLASIDYEDSSDVVTQNVVDILQETLDVSSVEILIELKERFLSVAYSSTGLEVELPLDTNTFDLLLNANRSVVFKSHIESDHIYQGVQNELTGLFEKTKSEALILLREGRHIFGVLFLGAKRNGGAYSDYDFDTFQNLYSYFFVIGYYMKNIANESVVGTVIRELQMSGQIIQSIQENIDIINNPKVDVGYISVSAHNLGGEFVDFIRLTDERYIMVIGDVSGKGINASMSMVILKSLIRTFLSETKDFKELVQKVNYFIRMNLPKGTFLAGLFALVDFKENTMYYINCGVPALFMYNQAYNNVIEIQGDGRILGFVKDVSKIVKVKKVKLNPGDIIVACTDGLIDSESLRGEPFGKDRVQKSIHENMAYPADKMAKFLHSELLEFTSKELEDDLSVIAVKYLKNVKA